MARPIQSARVAEVWPTPAPAPRILVIGYGNPGRRDDGLGPALATRLAALALAGVTVESDYQLSIEMAELVARHDMVVFADAAVNLAPNVPFYLRPTAAAPDDSCFTHHLSPPMVLRLAADLFGARPQAWLLGIRARDLDSFVEGLTSEAEDNLGDAMHALCGAIAYWRNPALSASSGEMKTTFTTEQSGA